MRRTTERRLGLIPSVNLRTANNLECAMLVTDRRVIIMPETSPRNGWKEFLKDMFGSDDDGPVQVVDLEYTPIDTLAGIPGSKSIHAASIQKVEVSALLGNYQAIFMHTDRDGTKGLDMVDLSPPAELVKANKAKGISPKETKRQYALKSQQLIKRVVPPMVALDSRWLE